MSVFQRLALAGLAILWLRDIYTVLRGRGLTRLLLLRCCVWLTAAAAIACPNLVQMAAEILGVGRGADVVLYVFVLAFVGVSFYFYARYVRLQRQISQLVRHIALREACRGGDRGTSTPDDDFDAG